MVSQNVEGITLAPWGVVAPAVFLAVLAVSANRAVDLVAAKVGG
jgi:peptide/nickel transport system permease protein